MRGVIVGLSVLWCLSGCYSVDLTLAQPDAGDPEAHLPTLPSRLPDASTRADGGGVPDGGFPVTHPPDAPDQPDPSTTDAGDGGGESQVGKAFIALTVEAGGEHTCAISAEGSLHCWGQEVDTSGDRHVWASVSAGHTHSCAITVEGRLFCWGSNHYGELGIGSRTVNYAETTPTPVEVTAPAPFSAVAAGENHTCAVSSGRLLCWGRASDGELGSAESPDLCRNDDPCALTPQPIDDHDDWTDLVASGQTTCGLRGGAIYCWGWSALNQRAGNQSAGNPLDLGCDGAPCATQPVTRIGDDTDWASISTWASRTCAIKHDGSLWCWGSNEWWTARQPTPTQIDLPAPVQTVATGEDHTCVVTQDSTLYCWGFDTYGQIGDGPGAPDVCGDFGCALRPVRIGQGYADVTVGYFHTCAQRLDGGVWCWGANRRGQLGSVSSEQCATGAEFTESCATQPTPVTPTHATID